MNTELYTKGLTTLNQIHGGHVGEAIINDMKEICPDYATMTIEWAFGVMMNRPQLDLKTRELVIIASCVTLGHTMPQLRAHIEAALTVGATKDEIIEVILQMAFYAGFAATTNAMYVAKEVFSNSTTAVTQ
jgi:4-carboxymuconolactone decarboxylase